MQQRKCPICKEKITGRRDKIYCSLNCKSIAQYEKRLTEDKFYLKVDKQLKINRKILKRYNRTGMTSLRREVLYKEGFDPNFFTHYWKNKNGEVYLFCYDFGFFKLTDNKGNEPKEKYLIVEWQDYMNKAITVV